MDIKKFEKIKKKVEFRNFEDKYGVLDKLLNISSFLGNIASIFFAFFFITKLLVDSMGAFPGSYTIISVISIVSMVIFELLKRYVFKNLTLSILSKVPSKTEIFYNIFFTIVLISGSFYLSLSGAREFADKSHIVIEDSRSSIIDLTDSVIVDYDAIIKRKVDERDIILKTRSIYVDKMAGGEGYSSRLKEYNNLISDANIQLSKIDSSIRYLQSERDQKIEEIKLNIESNAKSSLIKIEHNKVNFLLISSFIEFLILIGVYFHTFYTLKIYTEFKRKLINNPQYHIYEKYRMYLSILYNDGNINEGDQFPALSVLSNMIKHIPLYTDGDEEEFIEWCKSYNICTDFNGKTVITKTHSDALNILSSIFAF